MRSQTLGLLLILMAVISVLGLLLFTVSGGFNGRGHGMAAEVPNTFWLLLFVAPLFVVATVVGYALIFPELTEEQPEAQPPPVPTGEGKAPAIDVVLRVLNDEEQKVIKLLVAEGGTMLQKNIRWKTGLSRVKTHRILHRLAKRGIVSAEKYYNTNKITLADWLTGAPEPPSTDQTE